MGSECRVEGEDYNGDGRTVQRFGKDWERSGE